MADTSIASGTASFMGFATIREIGPQGMVTLRADLGLPQVAAALRGVLGVEVPGRRTLTPCPATPTRSPAPTPCSAR